MPIPVFADYVTTVRDGKEYQEGVDWSTATITTTSGVVEYEVGTFNTASPSATWHFAGLSFGCRTENSTYFLGFLPEGNITDVFRGAGFNGRFPSGAQSDAQREVNQCLASSNSVMSSDVGLTATYKVSTSVEIAKNKDLGLHAASDLPSPEYVFGTLAGCAAFGYLFTMLGTPLAGGFTAAICVVGSYINYEHGAATTTQHFENSINNFTDEVRQRPLQKTRQDNELEQKLTSDLRSKVFDDVTSESLADFKGAGLSHAEARYMLSASIVVAEPNANGNVVEKVMIGDDLVSATKLADIVVGGTGSNKFLGKSGDDMIYAGFGNDTVKAGRGDDVVLGGRGADILLGGSGADEMEGGIGGDTLRGGAGRDKLLGEIGKDSLLGGRGNDTLYGMKGSDELDGGSGDDYLVGGRGADTFIFRSGQDTVADFNPVLESEVIDLSGVAEIDNFEQLTGEFAQQTDEGVVIGDTQGNSLLIFGVQLSELSEFDFLF